MSFIINFTVTFRAGSLLHHSTGIPRHPCLYLAPQLVRRGAPSKRFRAQPVLNLGKMGRRRGRGSKKRVRSLRPGRSKCLSSRPGSNGAIPYTSQPCLSVYRPVYSKGPLSTAGVYVNQLKTKSCGGRGKIQRSLPQKVLET